MKITGALLESTGLPVPYADSSPLSVCELDLGEPGPGELLIQIDAVGLCHSDLSVVDGSRPRPLPMLLGHEATGIVQELGHGTMGYRVGQRVTTTFLPRCGACRACATEGRLPCEVGSAANGAGTLLGGRRLLSRGGKPIYHHLGVSGFATHAVVNALSCVPIDDDVPAEVAALLGCAVLTGGGAVINAARPVEGEAIAVVGLGGVGMAALLTAVSLGLGPVVGVDTHPDKLSLALTLGAGRALTPAEAREEGLSADVVIEAAGNPRAFETAVTLTAVGGVTVTVGLPAPGAMASISPLDLTTGARRMIGSYLGSAVPRRDLPRFLDLWRKGSFPVEALVSRHIRLDEINEALDSLSAGSELRQLIVFDH